MSAVKNLFRHATRWVKTSTRSLLLTLGGLVLIVAGIVMLVTPGPGLVAIAAGLALWSRQFDWAARLRHRIMETIRRGREDFREWRESYGADGADDDAGDEGFARPHSEAPVRSEADAA